MFAAYRVRGAGRRRGYSLSMGNGRHGWVIS
jgi:hypothetical protein